MLNSARTAFASDLSPYLPDGSLTLEPVIHSFYSVCRYVYIAFPSSWPSRRLVEADEELDQKGHFQVKNDESEGSLNRVSVSTLHRTRVRHTS